MLQLPDIIKQEYNLHKPPHSFLHQYIQHIKINLKLFLLLYYEHSKSKTIQRIKHVYSLSHVIHLITVVQSLDPHSRRENQLLQVILWLPQAHMHPQCRLNKYNNKKLKQKQNYLQMSWCFSIKQEKTGDTQNIQCSIKFTWRNIDNFFNNGILGLFIFAFIFSIFFI